MLVYTRLNIPDLILIKPNVWPDDRGYFLEKYKQSEFTEIGVPHFKQDNLSLSKQGVIRGLHYQLPPHDQGKLVSVVEGFVWDVALDIRKNSPSFGKWVGVELSSENNMMFYIPPGFAHGFSVLSPQAKLLYKCTEEYSAVSERGIRFDDESLCIDWKVKNPILSSKDLLWPNLAKAELFN